MQCSGSVITRALIQLEGVVVSGNTSGKCEDECIFKNGLRGHRVDEIKSIPEAEGTT